MHLRRWQFPDLLVCSASEPVTSGNASLLSFAAVSDELDDLAAKARAHGGGRVDGPSDTAWNTRDLTTIDPDGNVVVFTAARPPDRSDPSFNEQLQRWNLEQGVAAPTR